MRLVCAALVCLAPACALPVVSAGTFLPAGSLRKGDVHTSVSVEAGRVLAGPSDTRQPSEKGFPPEVARYDITTWIASDASVRWQATDLLAVEGQAKLTNPVLPFVPQLSGASLGGRLRLRQQREDNFPSLELGFRGVMVRAEQDLQRARTGGALQNDRWFYRAWGLELPLVASYRVNPLFSITVAPFARLYWIRAWHVVGETTSSAVEATLQWVPVLSGGTGLSAALALGPLEVAPGLALELATKPSAGKRTLLLLEPGISVGTRW